MVSTKVEIDRFEGKEAFALLQQRMREILVHMKVVKALKGEKHLPDRLNESKNEEMMELAYNTIILYLGDTLMREVSKESTFASVWAKLEQLYMSKTLTCIMYLKDKLSGFKLEEDKNVDEYIDEFFKRVIDLEKYWWESRGWRSDYNDFEFTTVIIFDILLRPWSMSENLLV